MNSKLPYWSEIQNFSLEDAGEYLLSTVRWAKSSVDKWKGITGFSNEAKRILQSFNKNTWKPYSPRGQFNNYEYLVLLKLVHLRYLKCKWACIGDKRERLIFKLTERGQKAMYTPKKPFVEYNTFTTV
jgi:hypothetical protein